MVAAVSPLDGDAKPMPKAIQTASRTKRHRRPSAPPGKWAGIVAEIQGPCVP